ncbi:MAG: hypothetical protein ABL884_11330, partial [Methyloglobulus sp.]
YKKQAVTQPIGRYLSRKQSWLKNFSAFLHGLGLTLPSPTYLFGAILFGIIGFAAYRHGKKASDMATKWGGIALMLSPYATPGTWQLYAVGSGICVGITILRR